MSTATASGGKREGRPWGRLYPWDDWLGRDRVRLTEGRHYWCSLLSFAQQARNAASLRGVRISLRQVPGGVEIVRRDD